MAGSKTLTSNNGTESKFGKAVRKGGQTGVLRLVVVLVAVRIDRIIARSKKTIPWNEVSQGAQPMPPTYEKPARAIHVTASWPNRWRQEKTIRACIGQDVPKNLYAVSWPPETVIPGLSDQASAA